MMAARCANVGATLLQLVEGALDGAAFGAIEAGAAEANLHDVFETGVLGREALKELANTKVGAGGRTLAHALLYRAISYMRQGDNREILYPSHSLITPSFRNNSLAFSAPTVRGNPINSPDLTACAKS